MKIISKFKDYYDGGAVHGIDKTHTYLRFQTEIKNLPAGITEIIPTFYSRNLVSPHFDIIGFCGKIYPIMNFSIRDWDNKWERSPKQFCLYGDDSWTLVFNEEKNKLVKRTDPVWAEKFYSNIAKLHEEYNFLINHPKLNQVFYDYKVPVFHICYSDPAILTLNPNLKDFAFFKIKDTVQAFQEIEMFISNQLVSDTQVQVPVGSDKVIKFSKGFNEKSFRREKQ